MASISFSSKFKGEQKDFILNIPTSKNINEAQKVFNKAFKEALDSGATLREKLDDVMRSQQLWDDTKEQKLSTLRAELRDLDYRLRKGGIKKSQGRAIALRMIEVREESNELLSQRSKLDSLTAQGQAENAKFQQLIVSCLVYSDGSPVFKDLDDYLSNAVEPVAFEAAEKLAEVMTGYNSDDSMLPEYQFLKKFGFVDDKLRLLNSEGKLVDRDGRLIDENGRFIDKEGNFVDRDGRPVNEAGEYVVSFSPFLEEDGTPIVDASEKQEEKVEEKSVKKKKVLVTPDS